MQAVAQASPVTVAVKAQADMTSLAAAWGIMHAAVEGRPLTTPLKAVADIESALAAQAEMQYVVGHTLYDPLKAVADMESVVKAQAEEQAAVKPLKVPLDVEGLHKAFDDAARIVAQQGITGMESTATTAVRTVTLNAEAGLSRLMRMTRAELNDVARQVGIKSPSIYDTKQELAKKLLSMGPLDIQTKVDANAASLIDAIQK